MKKFIILLIIFVLGIGLAVIGYSTYGFVWSDLLDDIQAEANRNFTEIDINPLVLDNAGQLASLKVTARSHVVNISVGDEFMVTGKVSNDIDLDEAIKWDGNTLVVDIVSGIHWWDQLVNSTLFFGIGTYQNPTIDITIPSDTSLELLEVSVSSGTINITNLTDIKSMNLEATSGVINVTNVTADEITIKVNSGVIDLTNITSQTITTTASSGSVSGGNINTNKLTATVNSGLNNFTEVTATEINFTATSGINHLEVTMAISSIRVTMTQSSGSSTINGDPMQGNTGDPNAPYVIQMMVNSGINRLKTT